MEPQIDDEPQILHPGPLDESLLTRQRYHRSEDIWNGEVGAGAKHERHCNRYLYFHEKIHFQYYEKLSSKARAKPRSPSRSSSNEEDLEFRGRMVSAFLCHHCSEVTE
ncbi:hypothetical protein CMV_011208 [Castanea mollissima]|uniref:Uncharacterized protein n=1 Tax=Castanea mollissima TaxID=60419 RepID=A0A8J4RH30_9ROSI|nr:hypothetical protein CMV_011208 [Castanea mollissima]